MGTVALHGAVDGHQTLAARDASARHVGCDACRILGTCADGALDREVVHAAAERAEECRMLGAALHGKRDSMPGTVELARKAIGRCAYHQRGIVCQVDVGRQPSSGFCLAIVDLKGKVGHLLRRAYLDEQAVALVGKVAHLPVEPGDAVLHELSEPLHFTLIGACSARIDLHLGAQDRPAQEVELLRPVQFTRQGIYQRGGSCGCDAARSAHLVPHANE